MKLICQFIFILAFGCSSSPKNAKHVDYDGADPAQTPEWVYAPDTGCVESEQICAAGEGTSLGQADLRARKALAAVFETKIESKLDIHQSSFSDDEISELKETIDSQVNETVDEILKSTEISKRFEKNGLYFSLAALDRSKTSKSLLAEIEAIDNELVHLYTLKRKSSIKKMMGLLEKRALLSDKLLVIKGVINKAPVSFAQIQNIKFSSTGFNKIFVRFEEQTPTTLSKYFLQLMTNAGYQIRKDRAVDYIVDVKYKTEEAFLNVKGFKKYVFSFVVEAKSNLGEKIGTFTINEVQTGRDENDAFLKVRPRIQKEIENKLNLLNLK
ncbi:MAG: LPP20 family lipoprotein [Bacteriovoracaceae bacterium]|nr:LPP20 family lipoprotein [Bacteriovoracaceae bacterium]